MLICIPLAGIKPGIGRDGLYSDIDIKPTASLKLLSETAWYRLPIVEFASH